MTMNTLILFLLALSTSTLLSEEVKLTEQQDWQVFFKKFKVTGTIVIADERGKKTGLSAYNIDRATTAYSPASTFKIPHALFALDAGIIRDEFQIFPWDGVKRPFAPWNRDQNLRSSMQHSVVWLYEKFAQELGEKRELTYLTNINYGNCKPTGKSPFWIRGHLKISALEQITFLQKLHRNQLPFKIEHQRLVKDVMIVEADADWILRAKTGWTGKLAWWVGWLETPAGAVFFAANIDTPNKSRDLIKREQLPRAILESIQVLPNKSITEQNSTTKPNNHRKPKPNPNK